MPGVEPLTLLTAYGPGRDDPGAGVLAVYPNAAVVDAITEQWTVNWTREWERQFSAA